MTAADQASVGPATAVVGDEPPTSGSARWVRFALGLLIGAGALYAVADVAGGLGDSVAALHRVRVALLVPAALFEAASYGFLGLLMRRLAGSRRVSRGSAMRLGLVVLGLGNILPAAPVEGLTLAGSELRRRDVSPRRTALSLGLFQWFTTRAMFALAAFGALGVTLLLHDRHLGLDRTSLATLAVLVLIALPISRYLAFHPRLAVWVAVALGRLRRKAHRRSVAQDRQVGAAWHRDAIKLLGSSSNQAQLTALAAGWCLCDAACFRLALAAAGVPATATTFVLGYAAAMLGTLMPFVPAGFGAVETVVPTLLRRSGVPLSQGLAGVLTFRLVGTVLPAVAGAIALILLRRASTATGPDAVGAGRRAQPGPRTVTG
ncbi:MAG: putative rane protein [Acidimicrobiales bacterium]|nr:putative rane protein [Acidimicrobiales bacterium]